MPPVSWPPRKDFDSSTRTARRSPGAWWDASRTPAASSRDRSRYAYIPFGVGPHVCVGASLALTEILIAVAILAQRFRFRLAPGQPIEPVAWTTLRPLHGIMMTVEPRPESVPQSR
jgi:cytochrome P450